jgi:ubiquinone/menaquinone biosynthesis C-methylase UbiE
MSTPNVARRIDSDRLTAWYDFQAPFYGLWRNSFDSALVRRVAGLLAGPALTPVLDAGCGTGLFTVGLGALCPGQQFEGLDRSAGMVGVGLKQARKRGLANVSFRVGDVERLPYADASFAAVVAAGLLPNLNAPDAALHEFARVLRPGGRVVVVEFDRAAMTTAVRTFFRVMIAGYKLVSACCRRFRFADRWDIDTSTVPEAEVRAALAAAAFDVRAVERLEGHMVLHCLKGERACRASA